jgi:hypothetical protein
MQFVTQLYTSSNADRLAQYVPPRCQSTFSGTAQVYDLASKACVTVAASEVLAADPTDCGVEPFKVKVSGKCYDTNGCSVTPEPGSACLAGQPIPVTRNFLKNDDGKYRSVFP